MVLLQNLVIDRRQVSLMCHVATTLSVSKGNADAVYQRKKARYSDILAKICRLVMACLLSLNSWEYWEAKSSVPLLAALCVSRHMCSSDLICFRCQVEEKCERARISKTVIL